MTTMEEDVIVRRLARAGRTVRRCTAAVIGVLRSPVEVTHEMVIRQYGALQSSMADNDFRGHGWIDGTGLAQESRTGTLLAVAGRVDEIPTSLPMLVNIGNHFAWRHSSIEPKGQLYSAMEEVTQPFAPSASPVISSSAPHASFPVSAHLLSGLLGSARDAGCVAVFFVWSLRWRRVSLAMREAVPLTHGREMEALRRLERAGGVRQKIEMRLSRTLLQPGVFGIVRPVLMWPERISERLDDAHLETILAHELWHVRRRDNLAAALHMVVEAIFWIHPVVWWRGGRLIEEYAFGISLGGDRERACNEQVLVLGGHFEGLRILRGSSAGVHVRSFGV